MVGTSEITKVCDTGFKLLNSYLNYQKKEKNIEFFRTLIRIIDEESINVETFLKLTIKPVFASSLYKKRMDLEDESKRENILDKLRRRIIKYGYYLISIIEQFKLDLTYKFFNDIKQDIVKIFKYYEMTDYSTLKSDHKNELDIIEKGIKGVVGAKLRPEGFENVDEFIKKVEVYVKEKYNTPYLQQKYSQISNFQLKELKKEIILKINEDLNIQLIKQGKIPQFIVYIENLVLEIVNEHISNNFFYDDVRGSLSLT